MSFLLRTLIREILLEKRRLPVEDRIKEESINVLDEYVDKGYFFHLTNDHKLQGVNVKSSYDTPAGIYAYPLVSDFYKDGEIDVPFAGDRKYVIIYKLKPGKEFVRSSTYSYKDLDIDGQKLGFSDEQIKIAQRKAKYSIEMSALMYLLYSSTDNVAHTYFTTQNGIRATNRLRKLGYAGMFDDAGAGIIHENEQTQAFFVGSDVCEAVKIIDNPSYVRREHKERIQKFIIKKLNSLNNEDLKKEILQEPKKVKFLYNNEKIQELIFSLSENELKNILIQNINSANTFKKLTSESCFLLSTEFQIWFVYAMGNQYGLNAYISNDAYKEILLKELETNKDFLTDVYFRLQDDIKLSDECLNALKNFFEKSDFKTIKYIIQRKDTITVFSYINNDTFKKIINESIKKNSSLDKDDLDRLAFIINLNL